RRFDSGALECADEAVRRVGAGRSAADVAMAVAEPVAVAVDAVGTYGGAGGVLPEDAAGNFSWFLGRHFAIMYIACECKRPMASYERRI
ncbi:MAG TPA: hypothetical protein PKK20_04525, partial [Verrucomicrobiota bacterium]|nr:hypothetical protein [Verrucomicrobiota bacterium]